jgi:hypothetical protein
VFLIHINYYIKGSIGLKAILEAILYAFQRRKEILKRFLKTRLQIEQGPPGTPVVSAQLTFMSSPIWSGIQTHMPRQILLIILRGRFIVS